MNIIPKRLIERLSKFRDSDVPYCSLVAIPQDAAVVLNYGGYPQNEIAIINKLQNQQQVDQALARIKTNTQKPSVTAEEATFGALADVKSRYLQEPSEVQDYIMMRLDEVGAFIPNEESPVVEPSVDDLPVDSKNA